MAYDIGLKSNNLKYLYHHSEVLWLFNLRYRQQIKRLRLKAGWHTVKLSRSTFYYRAEVDQYCDEYIGTMPEQIQFSESLALDKLRLAIPRHDLDLSIWSPLSESSKVYLFRPSTLIPLTNNGRIRSRLLYGIRFLYRPDIEELNQLMLEKPAAKTRRVMEINETIRNKIRAAFPNYPMGT